jgi:CheY-like chemotaxis protein
MDTEARRFVLIAEDDAQTARVLARMLREDGYEVEVVLDGAAAISRLSRGRLPDILIVDYRLPHADGLAVARYARARSEKVCVVLVTSYAEVVQPLIENDPSLIVLGKPLAYAELIRRLPAP